MAARPLVLGCRRLPKQASDTDMSKALNIAFNEPVPLRSGLVMMEGLKSMCTQPSYA